MSQNSISYLDSLYYGASNEIIHRAKELRMGMTSSEKILWERINKGQIHGLKFRRQHPISIFIADFYCHKLKLVIEIDGNYHNSPEQQEYDLNRTAELSNLKIKLIRFTNNQVKDRLDEVINAILTECKLPQHSP